MDKWRSQLADLQNHASENDDRNFVKLLDAVIGLLDAGGKPNGKSEGLTGIYARTWQAILRQLPHNQDTSSSYKPDSQE